MTPTRTTPATPRPRCLTRLVLLALVAGSLTVGCGAAPPWTELILEVEGGGGPGTTPRVSHIQVAADGRAWTTWYCPGVPRVTERVEGRIDEERLRPIRRAVDRASGHLEEDRLGHPGVVRGRVVLLDESGVALSSLHTLGESRRVGELIELLLEGPTESESPPPSAFLRSEPPSVLPPPAEAPEPARVGPAPRRLPSDILLAASHHGFQRPQSAHLLRPRRAAHRYRWTMASMKISKSPR